MPQYEFVCPDCKQPFAKSLTLSMYERGQITCPTCGSGNIAQPVSVFYPVPRKKSAA